MSDTSTPPDKGPAESDELRIERQAGESNGAALARTVLEPAIQAALAVKHYTTRVHPDSRLNDLVDQLRAQSERATSGETVDGEAMLIAQATTLNAIFNDLACRALERFSGGGYQSGETYLKLALRAQGQARATIASLSLVKNPATVAIVQQANIAAGPQQINNAMGKPTTTRAREGMGQVENAQNKLLGRSNGERLEFGAAGEAGGADSQLETVGEVNGAEDG